MYPCDFDDALTLPLAPPSGLHCWLLMKCLDIYKLWIDSMDYHEI